MLTQTRCSLVLLLASLFVMACGDQDRPQRAMNDADQSLTDPNLVSALAGTYQNAENGQARLQISNENIVTGSTLEIPSPAGDGTRLVPRFPQALVYDAAKGYYSTIGTVNDGEGIFKNVELRLRLYENNRLLDVTLILPPDEALANGASVSAANEPGQNPSQNEKPCQGDKDKPCPVCPEPQLFYVYRFVRI